MAGSSAAKPCSHHPARSISLPSRLDPNSQKIEAQLNKLNTNWDSSFTSRESPLASDTIQSGLADLAELYNSTKELIHSPLTQQALIQPHLRKMVEDTLDGSIGLLDACGSARGLLLAMKEKVESLQSALRRRVVGDSSVETNIQDYLSFRKNTKKEVAKSLRALKTMQKNLPQIHVVEGDHHPLQVVTRVLRELSSIAIPVLRSLFMFLSAVPVTKTKANKWSLISKLVAVNLAGQSERGHKILNQVGSVDISLCSLQGQLKKNDAKNIDLETVQRRLQSVDACIDGLDSGLDCLFRCQIQHRVALLNLLTP